MKFLRNRIVYHTLFWLVNFIFLLILFSSIEPTGYLGLSKIIGIVSFLIVIFMVGVYLNLNFLIPQFLKTKKFYVYAILLFITISGLSLIKYYFILKVRPEQELNIIEEVVGFAVVIIFYIGFTLFLKFFKEWIKMKNMALKMEQLEKQAIYTELALLKSQVNPHFLFNTLNNIYALTLIKSDDAPKLVMKLSGLMRYMLESSKKKLVSLSDEISYIASYIELEKARLSFSSNIQFLKSGDLSNYKIAPMIFIPFIENVFKHGVNAQTNNLYVKIDLSISNNDLVLLVENSISKDNSEEKVTTGMGIHNVKKRLEMLYPNNYTLAIKENKDLYQVELKIKLNYEI